MDRKLYINLDKYLDLVERVQDENKNIPNVSETIDELIDIAYEIAKEG